MRVQGCREIRWHQCVQRSSKLFAKTCRRALTLRDALAWAQRLTALKEVDVRQRMGVRRAILEETVASGRWCKRGGWRVKSTLLDVCQKRPTVEPVAH